MKLISCHDGKLLTLDASDPQRSPSRSSDKTFRTGLAALDELVPAGAFARGAVHELLAPPGHARPTFFAGLLARHARDASSNGSAAAVVWSDPRHELYPPALAALGIPLRRLFLLHPANEADQVWAVAECLRCRGVSAVVASLPDRQRFSRVEARRLQLAAEQGGSVGLLMRVAPIKTSDEHAAVTRWLVRPTQGERNVQRWRIQLIFGHGGQVGRSVILEHHRRDTRNAHTLLPRVEAHRVREAAELADRPAAAPAGRATG